MKTTEKQLRKLIKEAIGSQRGSIGGSPAAGPNSGIPYIDIVMSALAGGDTDTATQSILSSFMMDDTWPQEEDALEDMLSALGTSASKKDVEAVATEWVTAYRNGEYRPSEDQYEDQWKRGADKARARAQKAGPAWEKWRASQTNESSVLTVAQLRRTIREAIEDPKGALAAAQEMGYSLSIPIYVDSNQIAIDDALAGYPGEFTYDDIVAAVESADVPLKESNAPTGNIIGYIEANIDGDYRYNQQLSVTYDPSTDGVAIVVQDAGAVGGMDYHGPGEGRGNYHTSGRHMLQPGAKGKDLVSAIRNMINTSADTIKRYGKPSKNFVWGSHPYAQGQKGLNAKLATAALQKARAQGSGASLVEMPVSKSRGWGSRDVDTRNPHLVSFAKEIDFVMEDWGYTANVQMFDSGYVGIKIEFTDDQGNPTKWLVIDQPGKVGMEDQSTGYIFFGPGGKAIQESNAWIWEKVPYIGRKFGDPNMRDDARQRVYDAILDKIESMLENPVRGGVREAALRSWIRGRLLKELDFVNRETGEVVDFGEDSLTGVPDAAVPDLAKRLGIDLSREDLSPEDWKKLDDEVLGKQADRTVRRRIKKMKADSARLDPDRLLDRLQDWARIAFEDYAADNPGTDIQDVAFDLADAARYEFEQDEWDELLWHFDGDADALKVYTAESMG